jgi:hypothetical protein
MVTRSCLRVYSEKAVILIFGQRGKVLGGGHGNSRHRYKYGINCKHRVMLSLYNAERALGLFNQIFFYNHISGKEPQLLFFLKTP